MVELLSASPREAIASPRAQGIAEIGDELPRLAYVLALWERTCGAATALKGGQGDANSAKIGRWLREALQARLAVRLAPRLGRRDAFSAVEQWLVNILFANNELTTQRNLQRMLWVAARKLEGGGRLGDALNIYHLLLERMRLSERQIVIALLSGLKSGDWKLVDTCLQHLVAVATHHSRPLPVPESAAARFAGVLNAILKELRRGGDFTRADTFIFAYLAKFEGLDSLPHLSAALRRLAGDLRRMGQTQGARRLRRLLATQWPAGESPVLNGGSLTAASASDRLVSTSSLLNHYLEQVRGTNAPALPPAAHRPIITPALGKLRMSRGARRTQPAGEPPAAALTPAESFRAILRELRFLKGDEYDQAAATVKGRIETLAASQTGIPPETLDCILDICEALIKQDCLDSLRDIVNTLAENGPETARLLVFRGHIEKWTWRLEEACGLYRRALELPGCDPATYWDLAEALEFLGDDDGAIAAIRTGSQLCEDDELFVKAPGYLTQIAGPMMRQGRIAEGWEAYQKRRDRYVFEPPLGTKIWQGERLSGDERLLLLAEKGLGDEIRYASCYPDLLERVRNVAVSCDPRLMPLMQRSFPNVTFIPAIRGGASTKGWKSRIIERDSFRLNRALTLDMYCLAMQFEWQAMAGDLPLYLRRSRDAFPSQVGYLHPDAAKRQTWRTRLAEMGPGLKVGVSWRSASMGYRRQRQHYFRLEELLPVIQAEGVHFVNLQYDDCEEELARLERDHGIAVHRWADADLKDDLDGVAALMKELDLVIAPHTMVKELAGAVGTPTLFMAPTGQAWVRWRADPETKADIWHPSLTHIQSARAGDKEDVIRRTKAQLERFVAERGRADWAPATSGRHGDGGDGKAEADCSQAAASAPEPMVNAYGETYVPAPAGAFADRAARDEEWSQREEEFRAACARLFDGTAQPAEPKGVLLICNIGSDKQDALTVFSAHGVMQRGWASIPLSESSFDPGPVADPDIAHFREALVPAAGRRAFRHRDHGEGLRLDWEIDWPGRVCRAEGINFYGIIANRLGKDFRRYSVDIEEPKAASNFEALLRSCDAALSLCLEAEERLAGRGLQVRITGFEPNYPPTGVFKVYCSERGHRHGIEFVEIRQAYEKYFRAGRSGLVTAIDAQNVTRHHLYSAGAIRGDQFEAWLRENGEDEAVVARAEGWVKQDRSGHGRPTPEGEIVLERIRRHKAAGGKVACLYGKIPFDFGHPWLDEGPAHRDMRDWYNHTVATLNGSDVLLLVKPHPSEADFEQFGRAEEFFVEMLREPTGPNIGLLGHRWLNNVDLIPHLDFGITWRGTIDTELALMGVPVVVCGRHSMTDHVLVFPAPRDRADYEHMLRNSEQRITLAPDLKRRAAMIFAFYRAEMMVDYTFGWIPAKRNEAGPPVLSKGSIEEYLAQDHPSVDRVCRRMILD